MFFKWGIKFEEAYTVEENGNRQVAYANSTELMNKIIESYNPDFLDKKETVKVIENKDNKQTKEKQAPIRTKRPIQKATEDE